jgi:hypothetical protein
MILVPLPTSCKVGVLSAASSYCGTQQLAIHTVDFDSGVLEVAEQSVCI